MRLGMIGMGRMGAAMARRLLRAGHEVVAYDAFAKASEATARDGAMVAGSIADLVAALEPPRVAWLMLPAGAVQGSIDLLVPLLEPGDVIVDGGNSFHGDDIRRAQALEAWGLRHVDVGVSGGVWGLERGYCLMIGGLASVVRMLEPLFIALAPGVDVAPRTHRSEQRPSPEEVGYLHCGPSGAGHFVKMVHNGIEYGIMAAYAEGLNILRHADAGKRPPRIDAETTPLREPALYQYDLDLAAIAELWRHESVIRSWLLDLIAQALAESPDLERFRGPVADSGEGRWTVQAAIDEGVPAQVLCAALHERFASRGERQFADSVISAMRSAFGGHPEKTG